MMPDIRGKLRLRGWWEGKDKECDKLVGLSDSVRTGWISVHADQEYLLLVDLKRLNKVCIEVIPYEINEFGKF